MKRNRITIVALALLLLTPGAAMAANTVLSGIFDGSESKTDPLPGTCGGTRLLGYQDSGELQVSASGTYLVADVFNVAGVDVAILIYEGSFNPASPAANLVTPNGIDIDDYVDLDAGTPYRLVVQQWCENNEGAWVVTLSGPGTASSPASRTVPEMTQGVFADDDPRATSACSTNGQYHEAGPFRVSSGGTYYYADILWETEVDICLQVYTAPFDPGNPDANRVGDSLDDFDSVALSPGQDYYFVVQPLAGATTGEYFYVLAPPAPFRINKSLAGAWFDPATDGQGMFIDVYDDRNLMFVGWYTYDLSRPVDGTAQLGEPGHRWLTAFGTVDVAKAELDVYLAEGGAFDSANPPVGEQTVVGSLTVEFSGCSSATADYSLTTPPVSGQIPLQPLANSHVELCESKVLKPGMPGPL